MWEYATLIGRRSSKKFLTLEFKASDTSDQRWRGAAIELASSDRYDTDLLLGKLLMP